MRTHLNLYQNQLFTIIIKSLLFLINKVTNRLKVKRRASQQHYRKTNYDLFRKKLKLPPSMRKKDMNIAGDRTGSNARSISKYSTKRKPNCFIIPEQERDFERALRLPSNSFVSSKITEISNQNRNNKLFY